MSPFLNPRVLRPQKKIAARAADLNATKFRNSPVLRRIRPRLVRANDLLCAGTSSPSGVMTTKWIGEREHALAATGRRAAMTA